METITYKTCQKNLICDKYIHCVNNIGIIFLIHVLAAKLKLYHIHNSGSVSLPHLLVLYGNYHV